ncbi:MAG: glycosyltransferase [Deltaproteobacteria bacterium]|nr:glycosyltransferase [Deltaproteobacteria bacterium]MDL1961781.1 glycosyltransferase [Deltaproteobacteria bacterium]
MKNGYVDPEVSVIIPAYNHVHYVRQAIESITNQTFSHWELIIIDDGSVDGTENIVDKYSDQLNIQVLHQENQGLSSSLNRGLDLAQGRYFGFLPSDDLFYPKKLDIQVRWLEAKPDIAALAGHQTLIDHDGQLLTDHHVQNWFDVSPKGTGDFLLSLLERNFISAPSVLLRTEILRDLGGFDPDCIFMQDYDLWFRLLKNYEMKVLPEPVIYYRWHGGNLTYKATPATEAERARVLRKAAELLEPEEIFPVLWKDRRPEVIARCRTRLHEQICRNRPINLEEIQAIFDKKFRRISENRTHHEKEEKMPSRISAPCQSCASVGILLEVSSLHRGGLEQVVHDLALGFANRDHRVVVVCTEAGGDAADLLNRTDNVALEILPPQDKEPAYKEILARYKVDVVNAHYSSFGTSLAAEANIPVVTAIHNIYAWLSDDILSEFRSVDPFVSHYIAVSDDVASFLKRRFQIDERRVSVIPNGFDFHLWSDKRKEISSPEKMREALGLSQDNYVFLTVGSIYRVKGQDRIVRIFSELLKSCPDARAIFVGQVVDQQFNDFLNHLIEEEDLKDKIILLPFGADVPSCYALADAFVLPSVIEGWSLAMLEAMFWGLPIIMPNIAGARTIMQNWSLGALIRPPFEELGDLNVDFFDRYTMMTNDPTLSELLDTMRDFCQNRKKWHKKGLIGTDVVKHEFNLNRTVSAYENLLLSVIINSGADLLEKQKKRSQELFKALDASQSMISRLVDYSYAAWQRGEAEKHQNSLEKENERLIRDLRTIYDSNGWKLLTAYRKGKRVIKKFIGR